LHRTCRLVVSDPDILGGNPIFRGTRIPVHPIAEPRAQGASQPMIASYPRLTSEMIRLAPVYAAAYPLRGPKRKLPWHDQLPVCRRKRSRSRSPLTNRTGSHVT
jgi:uncharacterized protein (DUF433 family)